MNHLKPQRPEPRALGEMVLDHLVADPELLGRFMTETGYDPPGLRKALRTPALDAGLIDYVVRNEPLLLAVCAANEVRPEDFMAVWQKLNRSDV